ncbi:MAG: prepilin-type N-terminal cleavage/methylation domain-containing protein [Gemmatimonadota bacterium]|nr:MAG: prepilin-type N-terminal cleavage/methylation domain-containing protein [Gemmatimonadota bacterium]
MRSSKGFTLIELLIVVVIIGILAAIAIPKFANTKEKAYISAMKSDLRNMAAAEEAYFADFLTYTTGTTAMDYNPSQGVTVHPSSADAGKGWSATAEHTGTDVICEIYYGAGESGTTATIEGVVACATP